MLSRICGRHAASICASRFSLATSAATLLLVAVVAVGQPASVQRPGMSESAAADAAWQALLPLLQADGGTTPGNGQITTLLSSADQFRAFYTAHPTHDKAKDAKCIEGILLLRAALAGDTSADARRTSTVAQIRNDRAVTPALRAELWATSDSVSVIRQRGLTRDQRLLGYEQSARGVMAEFPDLPNGYETLLHIAGDCGDAKGATLAAEVRNLRDAPGWVKAEAGVVAKRFGLVGQSLRSIMSASATPVLADAAGHAVILYSWASRDVGSILRAALIPKSAPADAVIIGVCLDSGTTAAQAIAAARKLPGTQVYDSAGEKGAAVSALVMSASGLIYAADRSGVIRTVSAQTRLDSSAVFAGL